MIDMTALDNEPLPPGTPNFKADAPASSGESGEPRKARPGIFDASRRSPRSRKTEPKLKEAIAPPKLDNAMRQKIEDFYSGIGALIRPMDELTGETLIKQAPDCAKAVFDLAQTNDSVRRFVLAFTTTSVTMVVVFAHLPILLAVMRHTTDSPNAKMGIAMAYAGLMTPKKGSFAQSKEESKEAFDIQPEDDPEANA